MEAVLSRALSHVFEWRATQLEALGSLHEINVGLVCAANQIITCLGGYSTPFPFRIFSIPIRGG